MHFRSPFIYALGIIELIQLKTSLANQTCDNPWQNGLNLKGSVQDTFQNIGAILQGFLNKDYSESKDFQHLKTDVNECSKNPHCSFYALLDKEREHSMILCVNVQNSSYCYAVKCTCQKRQKRAIKSHLVTKTVEDKDNKHELISAKCEITSDSGNYCPTGNTPNISITKRSDSVQKSENIIPPATTLRDRLREKDKIPNSDQSHLKENPWTSFLMFFIGALIGSLFGSIFTYFCLKRKASKTKKSMSVLNSIYYKKEVDSNEQRQDFIEYSEIPERPDYFDEKRSQITEESRKLERQIEYSHTAYGVNNQRSLSVFGLDTSSHDSTKDNAVVTIETDSKYYCIEGISSPHTKPSSLKDDGHITPQQPTSFENDVQTDTLYFKLDKQQSTSILTEKNPESRDDYLKMHPPNVMARHVYPVEKELSMSLEFDNASLYVEPFVFSNAETNNQDTQASIEHISSEHSFL